MNIEWTKAILILRQCAEAPQAQVSGEKGSCAEVVVKRTEVRVRGVFKDEFSLGPLSCLPCHNCSTGLKCVHSLFNLIPNKQLALKGMKSYFCQRLSSSATRENPSAEWSSIGGIEEEEEKEEGEKGRAKRWKEQESNSIQQHLIPQTLQLCETTRYLWR